MLQLVEAGRRDHPRDATLLLAELLTHLNSPEAALKKHSGAECQLKDKQIPLKAMLHENEYQHLLLEKNRRP